LSPLSSASQTNGAAVLTFNVSTGASSNERQQQLSIPSPSAGTPTTTEEPVPFSATLQSSPTQLVAAHSSSTTSQQITLSTSTVDQSTRHASLQTSSLQLPSIRALPSVHTTKVVMQIPERNDGTTKVAPLQLASFTPMTSSSSDVAANTSTVDSSADVTAIRFRRWSVHQRRCRQALQR
jgi:hypothetical protein